MSSSLLCCFESSPHRRSRSGSNTSQSPKKTVKLRRTTGRKSLLRAKSHVQRRDARDNAFATFSATCTMMIVTMTVLLVFFLASNTVPGNVTVTVTLVEAKKISASKASSTTAGRGQLSRTIDSDENDDNDDDDDENGIYGADLSSYDNSRRRRRRRYISDRNYYSDYEDYDEDDHKDNFSCDSRSTSSDDWSYHRSYDECGNYDDSEFDDGLLDDEAEAILQALEKSEEQNQLQPQRRRKKSVYSSSRRRVQSPPAKSSLISPKKTTMRKEHLLQWQQNTSHWQPKEENNAVSTVSPSSPRRKKRSRQSSSLASPSRTTINSSAREKAEFGRTKSIPDQKTPTTEDHVGSSSGLPMTPGSMLPSSASSSSATKQSSPSVIATSKTTRHPEGPTRIVSMPKTSVAASKMTTAATAKSAVPATTTPWIRKFLQDRPDDKLLCIPNDFIGDNFNLSQLPPIIERIGYHVMGPEVAPTVAKALKARRQQLLTADREAVVGAAGQQQNSVTKSGGAAIITGSTKQSLPNNRISGSKSLQNPNSKSSQSALISQYPIYKSALRLILSDSEYDDEDSKAELTEGLIPFDVIQVAAEALYSFVHARFITSPRGLESVRQLMLKDRTRFGKCPRPMCCGTGTIPYGHTNSFTTTSMETTDATASTSASAFSSTKCHRYCPSCGEVWILWDSRTSGCAWGPSFCHLLLLAYGSQIYETELRAIAESNRGIGLRESPFTTSAPTSSQSRPTSGSPFSPRKLYDYLSSGPSTNSNDAGPQYPNDKGQSSPRPTSSLQSIYGFQIHPGTTFGRPWRMMTNNHNNNNNNEHPYQQQQASSTSMNANLNARGGAGESPFDV